MTKYYTVQEFVPPDIYKQFGEVAWQFIDPRLVSLANYVREFFGKPVIINNWSTGGTLTLRGFRPPSTTIGGTLSQHKFGRAFDMNVVGVTPQQAYKAILDNPKSFMEKGLTTMENIEFTSTWNHLDIRYTGRSEIVIVNP